MTIPRTLRGWCAIGWLMLAGAGVAVAATGDTPLVEAIKRSDTAMIRSLLTPATVNAAEIDGTTPLHWAVQNNDLPTVELLLRHGARATAATRYGATPLYLACVNGNAEVVGRLLTAGADPNAALPGHETALMTAARTGDADTVKTLLAQGADPNAREATREQSALMWAAAAGNTAAVRALIEGGADIHAISASPYPEQRRAKDGPASAAKIARFDRFTPLLFAVRAGHIDTVKALLDAGADAKETVPGYGASALVVAIINARWELASVLLERGADPNAAGQGWSALLQLVRSRSLSIGQFPHPVPTGGISTMQLAEQLLAHGADINARMMTSDLKDGYRNSFNRVGATPLLMAAQGADTEMITFLAAHGADVTATTKQGTNALMLAAGVEIRYPEEDGGTGPEALEALQAVMAFGLDVNAANKAGNTALHGAAFRGHNPIVELLIEKGATLDAANKRGSTPLTIADGDVYQGQPARRPHTTALLVRRMAERGLPIPPLRDKDVIYDFGTDTAFNVQLSKRAAEKPPEQ